MTQVGSRKSLDPPNWFACSRAKATAEICIINNCPSLTLLRSGMSVSRDSAPFQQVLEIKYETSVRAASSLCFAACEQRLEAV